MGGIAAGRRRDLLLHATENLIVLRLVTTHQISYIGISEHLAFTGIARMMITAAMAGRQPLDWVAPAVDRTF